MSKYLILLLTLIWLFCSCASIEGTRNRSYTYKNNGNHRKVENLAILPIEETSKFPMLPDMLEGRIINELRIRHPNIKIFSSSELVNELHKNNNLEKFSSWYAGYRTTKFLEFDKLTDIFKTIPVEQIISIRSVTIDRERIRGTDTGYVGMVSDSNNVYRTNLKFIGELIDLKQRKSVWQGLGYAENINSPRRDLDLLLVIKNFKNPEIEEFLGEMVSVAANGFVGEMMKAKK